MKIVYTKTDEAPALATRSLLPILRLFTSAAGVEIELKDISLAGRILAQFPHHLAPEQHVPDALGELGELVKTPEANVIKLPNISASVPQLKAAVAELQDKGYAVPAYPESPSDDDERDARASYDKVKGSAVNPVLRQGNSDRRASLAVKDYARKHPHSMGQWSSESHSHVASMTEGDFRSTERSTTVAQATEVRIEHVSPDGTVTRLQGPIALEPGEIIDAAVMRRESLDGFLAEQIAAAKHEGVLFSVHLKATMMRVSDPIIFGHAVRAFFPDLDAPGWNPNDGLGALPQGTEIPHSDERPGLAMVDSERGITNLHVPSDVIIDASIPAAIRSSGQMWNADGEQQDTKFVIPDHSYAALYAETIDDCRRNGAFDPATMGTTPNVGLMAQAAEEYGSHDKTFEIEAAGCVRVIDADGVTRLEHDVQEGDIWRMCQTKQAAVTDWIGLAVDRARQTGWPAVFWLDESRAHDAQVLEQVRATLTDLDTSGLEIEVMDVAHATRFTLERARRGANTISVTGNVLRDYLTDLFPILELGTSAKMQSIVPLMAGGGLFETGAGGSAPRHVQQFLKENHLRWDSLGEFLALGPSLELVATHDGNRRAQVLADTLDRAIAQWLDENRSPSRRAGELDNRGSHFYLALYWAEQVAHHGEDQGLSAQFEPVAARLAEAEEQILAQLAEVQGSPVEIGGYYLPDDELADAAMRPSATFNEALEAGVTAA